jgi:hypothetical protein
MQQKMRFGGFSAVVMIFSMVCLIAPALAQVNQEEEAQPEAILRVAIVDLKVQGKREPAAVREALTVVLPGLVTCVQAEYQRVGKVPTRITLRFNVGGNGKVVWCQVVDLASKSADVCLGKVLRQMQLPPAEEIRSRVTVVLEAKLDHLLAP